MKNIRHIFLAAAALILYSCIRDMQEGIVMPQTSGVIYVEILEQDGERADKMETVRLLVFTYAGATRELELNELFDIPAPFPGSGEVSKFGVTLEVGHNTSGVDDKLIFAIVNEPAAMRSTLDNVHDYNGLINLNLDFSDFLDSDHLSLRNDKSMPMTGVVRTDKVYETAQEAESDPAKMSLLRAVARVDVYVRKEADAIFDLDIGSNIALGNTYDKEYLMRNQENLRTYGNIQTVTNGFLTKSWAAQSALSIPDVSSGSNGLSVCSFYTPERTCSARDDADKLILDITAVSSGGDIRTGSVILNDMNNDYEQIPLTIISRNNVYRVIFTIGVGSLEVTATVVDWWNEDFEIEL